MQTQHSAVENGNRTFKSTNMADVTVRVGNRTVKAHKDVLVSMSEYFKAWFLYMNSKENEITFHDLDFKSICEIIQYGYSGQACNITEESVQDLFIASDYLQVTAVKKMCERFLLENVNVGNCVVLLLFAHDTKNDALKEEAMRCIGNNFEVVCKTEDFLEIPAQLLLELLQDDNLVVLEDGLPTSCAIREEILLVGVLRYIKKSKEGEKNWKALVESIRLPFIGHKVLKKECASMTSRNKARSAELKAVLRLAKRARSKQSPCVGHDIPEHWTNKRVCSEQTVFRSNHVYPLDTLSERDRYDWRNSSENPEEPTAFDDGTKVDIYSKISTIDIFVNEKEELRAIRGLTVTYDDGKFFKHGIAKKLGFFSSRRIDLENDEYISRVDVYTKKRREKIIDGLTFHTNKRNVYQYHAEKPPLPFQAKSQGLTKAVVSYESEPYTYLHGFYGTEMGCWGARKLTKLGFVWKSFSWYRTILS